MYKIVAERENQKLRSERASVLIAVAKARVWASEGWRVVVTDGSGTAFAPAEFDDLESRLCPIVLSPGRAEPSAGKEST